MKVLITLWIGLLLTCAYAQENFPEEELRGFTEATAGWENIPQPDLEVRQIKGRITGPNSYRLANAKIEVIGPEESQHLYSASTNGKGRFSFEKMPAGTYRYRISSLGFSAVFGKVTVSKNAPTGQHLDFNLPSGSEYSRMIGRAIRRNAACAFYSLGLSQAALAAG